MAMTNPSPPIERLAYSPAEVAAMLGVTRAHVHHMLSAGKLRSTLLGRRRLIPADALTELFDSEANSASGAGK